MDLPLWARLCIGLGLAAPLAYAATPVAIVTARRFAFYDHPAGYKGHAAPTPYLGGAAVMLAFGLGLLIGAGDAGRTLPVLGGVAILFAVGVIDDRRTVSPLLRVLVELIAGASLGLAGIGWHLGAGSAVDALVMAVWVVAVVNAFNLFDNMDGAASTMALVVGAAVCVLGVVSGNAWVAASSAALCGACLGFLPHNLSSPAKIFLGDGGSMPLGFAVAALVASAARSAEPSSLALLVGFLLIGVPVTDTALVIFSRRRRGVSILTGGQDHLTHRTRERVRTTRRVVMVLGSTQALVSALVIVATRESSATLVYILLAFMVAAGTTIGALESSALTGASTVPGEIPRTLVATPTGDKVSMAALLLLGIAGGISPLFSAYYDTGVWVPMGLVLAILAAAVVIARPPRLTPASIFVLGALGTLGLFSLLSGAWGNAVEATIVQGNLWLTYSALMLLFLALLRSRRHAVALLAGAAMGIAIVAAIVVVRMLGSDTTLFTAGRLNGPLGYVNGEGCVFAMGCWFAVALAERRQALLAGVGAGTAVIFACLTLLTESRGAAIATAVAILVALLVIPGARRRLIALAFIGAGFGAVTGPVAHVFSTNGTGPSIKSAAVAILISAAVVGVIWALVVVGTERLQRQSGSTPAVLARLATGAVIVVIALPVVAAGVKFHSIEHTLSSQWHDFVHLSLNDAGAAQSRLLSGGGFRYDFWRVAFRVFTSHPIAGVGAGNYQAYYYQQGRSGEPIQNPHSLELETLSELGVVGGLLLVTFVVGVGLGASRFRGIARSSPNGRTAMVAATGAAVAWFVDTSGDWMHLLPGVTAIALAAIAVLCQGGFGPGAEANLFKYLRSSRIRAGTLFGTAAIAFVLAVASASLLRSGLTDIYLNRAHSELGTRPAAAIGDAERALNLDGAKLDAYYVKAAGLARFDRAAQARAALLAAAREDPTDFVTWTLLGDLEVRLRNFASASSFYQRAHVLDPKDPSLAQLATDPASALSASGP